MQCCCTLISTRGLCFQSSRFTDGQQSRHAIANTEKSRVLDLRARCLGVSAITAASQVANESQFLKPRKPLRSQRKPHFQLQLNNLPVLEVQKSKTTTATSSTREHHRFIFFSTTAKFTNLWEGALYPLARAFKKDVKGKKRRQEWMRPLSDEI